MLQGNYYSSDFSNDETETQKGQNLSDNPTGKLQNKEFECKYI